MIVDLLSFPKNVTLNKQVCLPEVLEERGKKSSQNAKPRNREGLGLPYGNCRAIQRENMRR